MSIHPSLRSSDKNKKQRSVLKRTERLKIMLEKKLWKEGDDVFGGFKTGADGKLEATSLSIGKPPATKKDEKKEEKKEEKKKKKEKKEKKK